MAVDFGVRGVAKVAGPLRNVKPGNSGSNSSARRLASPELSLGARGRKRAFTALAESATAPKALLARYDGQRWSSRQLNVEKLRFAWRGPGKTWIATSESLFELTDNQPDATANDDIPLRRILDVAVEPGGAFWLANASGLFRHAPALWMTPRAAENVTSSVRAMRRHRRQHVVRSGNSLQRLQGEAREQYALPAIAEAARGPPPCLPSKMGRWRWARMKMFRLSQGRRFRSSADVAGEDSRLSVS
jgi:hypothetical protein